MKKLLVIIILAIFAGILNVALAQKPGVVLSDDPGWHKIGETVASFKTQDESIAVIGADEFAAIKLKIKDASLNIERLQVFYESGDMEEIHVRKRIQAGDESPVFTLENPEKDIQKVAFTYNTVPNAQGEKAEVELFGFKTDESSDAYRRDKKIEKTESDIERAADKTGDAIAETAAKGAAEIADQRHDTKVGPDGQTIYIDDDARFYYINEKGKKVYVSKIQLKDKPDKN